MGTSLVPGWSLILDQVNSRFCERDDVQLKNELRPAFQNLMFQFFTATAASVNIDPRSASFPDFLLQSSLSGFLKMLLRRTWCNRLPNTGRWSLSPALIFPPPLEGFFVKL